ncbi:hypothetical protein ES332_A10G134300v1 [Gossypium tomentosum]|uniref:ATP-citrate synthase/succinyl-CoA ligase C-terminal domain-containing protein n=1 Tax=Gossypium tomentosum TaxID=34277 RepID=A0A5D2NST0_GOSTO|nr:hypothetical protein ES332_A10G134300v1 [Gossypium tomentosum]
MSYPFEFELLYFKERRREILVKDLLQFLLHPDYVEQVVKAFKIFTPDDKVKAILVNIFGGIMKCDVIASGIINAAKQVTLKVPVVVRLEGTNVDKGKRILKESGMTLITADDLDDAAKKAVKAASK